MMRQRGMSIFIECVVASLISRGVWRCAPDPILKRTLSHEMDVVVCIENKVQTQSAVDLKMGSGAQRQTPLLTKLNTAF